MCEELSGWIRRDLMYFTITYVYLVGTVRHVIYKLVLYSLICCCLLRDCRRGWDYVLLLSQKYTYVKGENCEKNVLWSLHTRKKRNCFICFERSFPTTRKFHRLFFFVLFFCFFFTFVLNIFLVEVDVKMATNGKQRNISGPKSFLIA